MLDQTPIDYEKKNSILGSEIDDSAQGPDNSTPVEPHRRQPKRKATTMKNSKYDESNYLVVYSGKQNKIRRIEDSGLQISAETLNSGRNTRKRSAKHSKKVRITESNVFEQIKEIQINEGDLKLVSDCV